MNTKTIELSFPELSKVEKPINFRINDENNNNNNRLPAPTRNNVKTLDLDGLKIELLTSKKANFPVEAKKNDAKPKTVSISFSSLRTDVKPEEPVPVPVAPELTKISTASKQKVLELGLPGSSETLKIQRLNESSSSPAKPKVNVLRFFESPIKSVEKISEEEVANHDEINGAIGLWARNEAPEQLDTPVEPPPVTEEDWKIFKQFMEPPAPQPCYNKLLEMGKAANLVPNQEEFVCSICEEFVMAKEGVVLKNCLHNFCRLCLIDTIKTNHNYMGEVTCPFNFPKCDSLLDDVEVKTLLGDEFDKFVVTVMEKLEQKFRPNAEDQIAKLLNNENLDVIENFEAFECQICYVEIEKGDGVIIRNCLHKFCKECLVESIKHSEDFEVKCPEPDCKEKLQEREVRKLSPPEIFDKHLEKSLKLYQNASETAVHCKTPDCPGWIEADNNVRGFTCPACEKVNCIGCKAIHPGKNCQEYQDEVNPDGRNKRENEESENAIKDMIANGGAMYCPKCGIPVEKADGCDFITCSACRLGICWRTKKPRHPITKQDGTVIDGCHCRENGRPCHPDCGNCH